jgi:manganese/zinc/iron transport system permease protein
MVIAMLIAPAASAYLCTDRLVVMLVLSGIFGIVSAIVGYYIATFIVTSI